jgi:hypothetical protein
MVDRTGKSVEDRTKRLTAVEMDAVTSDQGGVIGILTLSTPETAFQFEIDDGAARALKKAMKRFLKLPRK